MLMFISKLFGYYFFLLERIPLFIYFIYRYYEGIYNKKLQNVYVEFMICLTIYIIGGVLVYSLIGFFSSISFYTLFGFGWHYSGIITWSIFFFIYFICVYYKTGNTLKTYVLSFLASLSGGWLYEIPFFHPFRMFFAFNTIFYIRSQIVCTILLFYELSRMKFKPNIFIFISLLGYLVTSLGTMFIGLSIYPDPINWFYRLPTVLFLISLISGIERKER